MNKKIQNITIVCFSLFIGIFSIINLFTNDRKFSENENRFLNQFPKFSLEELFNKNYTTKYEEYFTDQFVFRDEWIQIKALTNNALGSIENNGVYFGKDDALIQMFNTIDEELVAFNIAKINEFQSLFKDVRFDVMIVPTASEVEKDKLPGFAYNIDQAMLLNYLSQNIDGNWIDIYSPLKGQSDVFFNTDHHWNEKGAYLGYLAYMNENGIIPQKFDYEEVSSDFKGTMYSKSGAFWKSGEPIFKINAEDDIVSTVTFDDGTTMDSVFSEKRLTEKDKYTYYLDGNHALVRIENEGVKDDLGKLLIIKDSFAHIMLPYLIPHYSEIVVVDLRYYKVPLSEMIREESFNQVLFLYSIENFVSDRNFTFLK